MRVKWSACREGVRVEKERVEREREKSWNASRNDCE